MPTLRDYYNTDYDNQVQFGATGPLNIRRAQTFQASVSYIIVSVKLRLYRSGNPGTITVQLQGVSGENPDANVLASGTTNGDTLTTNTSGEWREITFSVPYSVVSGTDYAIVLSAQAYNAYWKVDRGGTYPNGSVRGSSSGETWGASVPLSDGMFETWDAVADIQQVRMGSVGDFLLVAAIDGVYLSTDLGDNWTQKQPDGADAGDTTWSQGICSSDGTYIIVVSDADAIYRSANSGTAWGSITPAGGDAFSVNDLAISDDGQYAVVVGQNSTDATESCYVSTDYGATWTAYKPIASSIEYTNCSISNDGTIIAVSATGYFYISLDSGATWLEQGMATTAEVWACLGISGDGTAGIVANTSENNEVFLGVKTDLYSEATWAESIITSAGRALLDDANAPAQATTLGLGTGDSPTWVRATLSGLTASKLVATDADKKLVSSDLASWVAQTANQVLVADDGDGTITLSLPQDIHTGANPTFNDATFNDVTVGSDLYAGNAIISSIGDLTLKLPEAAGATAVSIRDNGNNEVAAITSDGEFWSSIFSSEVNGVTYVNSQGFLQADDERLSLTGTGLGINKVAPAVALDVAGAIAATGIISAATGSTIGTLTLADGSITDSGGTIDFDNENLQTSQFVIANRFQGYNDPDTYCAFTADQVNFFAGGLKFITCYEAFIGQDRTTFNDVGTADIDFQVKAIGQANALFVQGSDGKVGIRDNVPGSVFDVTGDINTTEQYKVDDVQVVKEQQAHIADAPGDTAANNATTINAILVMLETHGLVAAT